MPRKKKETKPDVLELEFKVDPYQGAAAAALNLCPAGYLFERMERRGTKMMVTYVKVPVEEGT